MQEGSREGVEREQEGSRKGTGREQEGSRKGPRREQKGSSKRARRTQEEGKKSSEGNMNGAGRKGGERKHSLTGSEGRTGLRGCED